MAIKIDRLRQSSNNKKKEKALPYAYLSGEERKSPCLVAVILRACLALSSRSLPLIFFYLHCCLVLVVDLSRRRLRARASFVHFCIFFFLSFVGVTEGGGGGNDGERKAMMKLTMGGKEEVMMMMMMVMLLLITACCCYSCCVGVVHGAVLLLLCCCRLLLCCLPPARCYAILASRWCGAVPCVPPHYRYLH